MAIVSASFEDYGLTPLEAASFGRPSVVLRMGGFLDTVEDGKSGLFFDSPTVKDVAQAMDGASNRLWSEADLRASADAFSARSFTSRFREIIEEEVALV